MTETPDASLLEEVVAHDLGVEKGIVGQDFGQELNRWTSRTRLGGLGLGRTRYVDCFCRS